MTRVAALDTETGGLEPGLPVNVVSIYDVRARRSASFVRLGDSKDHLIHAMEAARSFDTLATFNGNFDFRMIAGYTDDPATAKLAARCALTNYDMLINFATNTGYMSSLDSFALGTLGEGKTGDGAHAVAMWGSGEHDRVREYCENDARITANLFVEGMRVGRLSRRTKAGKTQVWPLPVGRFVRTCDALKTYADSPPDVSWMDEPSDFTDIADWVVPLL
tara:strand:+ start:559 stop:1218 length:660 start_codon:yes stop_codon:yes gene_type:complete